MGLEVELEHKDLTDGDPIMTAKIVVAHLNEIPDYYTRLKKMESEAETKDADRIEYSKLMDLVREGRIEISSWISRSGNHGSVEVKSSSTGKYSDLFVENIPNKKFKDGGEGSGKKGHTTLRQKLLKQRAKKLQENKENEKTKSRQEKVHQHQEENTKRISGGTKVEFRFSSVNPDRIFKGKVVSYNERKNSYIINSETTGEDVEVNASDVKKLKI
jgi:cold shock CspA family protein